MLQPGSQMLGLPEKSPLPISQNRAFESAGYGGIEKTSQRGSYKTYVSMETGSERQKMQRKGEATEKTRGNDSAFFPRAQGGLRVRVDDASM